MIKIQEHTRYGEYKDGPTYQIHKKGAARVINFSKTSVLFVS